jgi:hypothetical protein
MGPKATNQKGCIVLGKPQMNEPDPHVDENDLGGKIPDSWHCVDCGKDTAPGFYGRSEMEEAIKVAKAEGWWGERSIKQSVDDRSEVYTVRDAVWAEAGMEPWGGCLCVGCLEKRLGRKLKWKDFRQDDPLNQPDVPGTERLLTRRKDKR